jgi:predicted N-acetyltransferase YhbS
VAVSPVSLSDGASGWYGLGPVSVAPARQGQGIGTRLVTRALADLRALGAAGCVVLGEPRYYSRFGFTTEPSLVLPAVQAAYFQALSFGGAVPTGTVTYHESFHVTA